MTYINNKQETLHLHTDSARDTQTGVLCFIEEEKVIQISELTSFQELQTLPPKTNLPHPYSYATATTALLESTFFCEQLYFQGGG